MSLRESTRGCLLFIAIGVVFLRYDGTAGLRGSLGLGDLTDVEYAAPQAVTEWAARVPMWAVLLALVAVAAAVAWRRRGPNTSESALEHERVGER